MALVRRLRRELLKRHVDINESGDRSEYFQIFDLKDSYGIGTFTIFVRGSDYLKRGTNIEIECLDEMGVPIILDIPPSSEEYEKRFLPSRRMVIRIDNLVSSGVAKLIFYGFTKDGKTVRWVRKFVINKEERNQLLIDKGQWVLNEYYEVGNVVQFSGSSYKTILSHEGLDSTKPPDSTYWTPFAESQPSYQSIISSEDGFTFTNDVGTVTLTASLYDIGGTLIDNEEVSYKWFIDEVEIQNEISRHLQVSPSDISGKSSQYRVIITYSYDGSVLSAYQTITRILDGISPPNIRLESNGQLFLLDEYGNLQESQPDNYTLSATLINTTDETVSWFIDTDSGLVALDGTPTTPSETPTVSVPYSLFVDGKDSLTIVSTINSVSDKFTFYRLREGSDSVTGILTNESVSLISDTSGQVNNYVDATTEFRVFRGIDNVTSEYVITSETNISTFILTDNTTHHTLTVSEVNTTDDTFYFNFTATSGSLSLTKTFNISKSKQGVDGVSLIYQGIYDLDRTYQRTNVYAHVVRDVLDTSYFIVKDGISEVPINTPTTNIDYWEEIPTFEMLATDLLLAKDVTIRRKLTLGDNTVDGGYGTKGVIESIGGIDINGNYTTVQNEIIHRSLFFDSSGEMNLGGKLHWTPSDNKLNVVGDINATSIVTESGSIGGWIVDTNKIYKGVVGSNSISIDSTKSGIFFSDGIIDRVSFGLVEQIDPESSLNLAELNEIDWTQATNTFETVAYSTPSSVKVTRPNGVVRNTLDSYVIEKNIGDLNKDSSISIKGNSFSYVDTPTNASLVIEFFKNSTSAPLKINELSSEIPLSTTSSFLKRGQVIQLDKYITGNLLDVSIKITISVEYLGDSTISEVELKNFQVFQDIPQTIINQNSALFFTNRNSYLYWDKDGLILKGGALDVSDVIIGNLVVNGSSVLMGDVTIEGSVDSHPSVIGAQSVTNTGLSVIQSLSFDNFGHVTGLESETLNVYTKTESDATFLNLSGGTITGDMTFNTDVSVGGELVVSGDVIFLGGILSASVETVLIQDNLLVINDGEVGNGISDSSQIAGIYVDRGLADAFYFVADENRGGKFAVGTLESLQLVATREDTPNNGGLTFWDDENKCLSTDINLTWDSTKLSVNGNGDFYKLILYGGSEITDKPRLSFYKSTDEKVFLEYDSVLNSFIVANLQDSITFGTGAEGTSYVNRMVIDNTGKFGFNSSISDTHKYNFNGTVNFESSVDISEVLYADNSKKKVTIDSSSKNSGTKTLTVDFNNTNTDSVFALAENPEGDGLLIRNLNQTNLTYSNLDFVSSDSEGRILFKNISSKVGQFEFLVNKLDNTPHHVMIIKNNGDMYINHNRSDITSKLSVNGSIETWDSILLNGEKEKTYIDLNTTYEDGDRTNLLQFSDLDVEIFSIGWKSVENTVTKQEKLNFYYNSSDISFNISSSGLTTFEKEIYTNHSASFGVGFDSKDVSYVSSSLYITDSLYVQNSAQITGSLDVSVDEGVGSMFKIDSNGLMYHNIAYYKSNKIIVATPTNFVIESVDISGEYNTVFFDYSVASGDNMRVGTVMAVGSLDGDGVVEYTDTSTVAIGHAGEVVFTVVLSSPNLVLMAETLSNDWTIKTITRVV